MWHALIIVVPQVCIHQITASCKKSAWMNAITTTEDLLSAGAEWNKLASSWFESALLQYKPLNPKPLSPPCKNVGIKCCSRLKARRHAEDHSKWCRASCQKLSWRVTLCGRHVDWALGLEVYVRARGCKARELLFRAEGFGVWGLGLEGFAGFTHGRWSRLPGLLSAKAARLSEAIFKWQSLSHSRWSAKESHHIP